MQTEHILTNVARWLNRIMQGNSGNGGFAAFACSVRSGDVEQDKSFQIGLRTGESDREQLTFMHAWKARNMAAAF